MTTPTPEMKPLKPCPVSARRSMSMDVIDKLCANCPNRAPSHEAELRECLRDILGQWNSGESVLRLVEACDKAAKLLAKLDASDNQ